MLAPLLESKLRVPRRRTGVVLRERLMDRLERGGPGTVTLVSAPAGFGKTTLLVEWLDRHGADRGIAWVSLDSRDNDPATYWAYVVAALRTAAGEVGAGAQMLLQSGVAPTEAALTELCNELDLQSRDVILVLDDYHVIEASEIHDAMTFVVEHLPSRLQLVLATRADPPLPLPKLRARAGLVEARSADLRFTGEETQQYLRTTMGLDLEDDDVTALENRTEGWIAALQLAGLSLQNRSDTMGFIAEFAGDDRYVLDYLAEEVLARLPDDVRLFLLQTSMLERLSGSLCDAVTASTGGKARLAALERANLFLTPLDDRREWYRYHQLFADVLRAHLLEDASDDVAGLHRRAAAWFEAHAETSLAVDHYLAAGDVDRAADVMERAMPVMQRERREAELGRWVRALPDDVVRSRPVLGVAFVGALAQGSDFATIPERLADIEAALRPEGGAWPRQPPPGLIVVDDDGFGALPATVEMYRAALALAGGDLSGTVAHAQEALTLAPPGHDLVRAAAGALGGLAAWTAGDLSGAHAAYLESVAGLERAGFIADVLGCCIAVGDIQRARGRLGDALRTFEWALDLAAATSGREPLRGTADMHVGIAEILLERGDVAAAAEHLAIVSALPEYNGLPQNPYRSRVVKARLREAEGDLDDALALLDEADRVYVGDYSPNIRPVAATRARLRLRRRELELAEAWALDQAVSADEPLTYLREYEHITLARILLARHGIRHDDAALDVAVELLTRLLAAAEDGGRDGSAVEVLVLLALAHQARRDQRAALDVLGRALRLAAPERPVRVFADEGQPMAALLKALPKDVSEEPSTSGYARRILASIEPVERTPASPPGLVEPLSARELDVLRLLATDLAGPDIARSLSVSLNTLRTHTKNIYAKLGTSSRRAAVTRARELDLLARPPR
ncbi:MAG: LuxR C-terminal-related transcriptional regulator [Actinomycetales bacterium]